MKALLTSSKKLFQTIWLLKMMILIVNVFFFLKSNSKLMGESIDFGNDYMWMFIANIKTMIEWMITAESSCRMMNIYMI